MKLKLLVVVFFVGIICPVLTGCAVKEGPVYVKDGTAYGKPAGLFKEKWHDYFLRGVSYGDGGYWADAVADFRHAIAQRRPDQRRARTYGFHFVDYFPNRELGISLYHLGEFEKSVDALEASLASCESARAKYYVNKARRGRLQESGMDTAGPAASIKFPTPDYVTRDLSVTLRAAVQDNYYVSQLNVNGAADILELSQQEMLYQKEVPLKRGENRITLQAVDLVGNRSWAEQITVRVDREGPLVLLGSRRIGGTVEVTGAACDGSALVRLSLNSRELPVRGAYVVSVKESFEVAPGDYANRIAFAAQDRAGNRTSGYVEIESDGGAVHQAALPRLAFAGPGGGLPVMQLPTGTSQALRQTAKKASDETDRPIITVKGLTDGQTVFCDSVVVDGTVRANAGIKALSINGQSFFESVQDSALKSFMEELRGRKKRLLHFGRIIQLAEGSNRITVEAVDGRGRPCKQVVTLVRKTPRARQIGSRLTLSVYPFAETIKSAEPLERYVQSSLIHAFVNQKRFNILERHKLERLLQEQKISRSAVFDQDQAVSLGR
ncbi:MAG: hypothetical protein GY868_01305, partial [Deltaproteobacteria bacterium]|nr:hypothetical protein [Deltaproteobacteria bacterium]